MYPISKIFLKLYRGKGIRPATVIPVVFLLGGIALNILVRTGDVVASHEGSFGGPADRETTLTDESKDAFLASAASVLDFPALPNDEGIAGFVIETEDSLMNPSHPLQSILPSRERTLTYHVEKGDTLSSIAKKFGITLDTILGTNEQVRDRIRPGQELFILPISGVLHTVQAGETVDSIAQLYAVDASRINAVNIAALKGGIKESMELIIPGAHKKNMDVASISFHSLPNLNSYFQIPTTGYNWGKLHPNNAVDIANTCGTLIYAAAEGLVVDAGSPAQWNGGAGGNVEIEHPNGTATRYMHTQENLVEPGVFVKKGELIALMGNTGNVHVSAGGNGCHLHLEFKGAQNPFVAKQ